MREHAHLSPMVSFVRKHVAQHFHADRPRPGPSISAKLRDAAPTTSQRFSKHLCATSSTLGQSRASLLRRAVRAVELWWNLQVRSGKPDPLGADIVHVGKDRRNGAGIARRFGCRFCFPRGGVKMFDKDLIHALIGGKDLDRGSAELSVNSGLVKLGFAQLGLTCGHGSCSSSHDTSSPILPASLRCRQLGATLRFCLELFPDLLHLFPRLFERA
jgi:hypothetical protein